MADIDVVKRVRELMNNPEYIRNICTCAHIDHGKCIAPDSRVILANGRICAAKDLFRELSDKGVKFEEKDEHIIFDTRNLDFNVFSLNNETGKIEKKQVQMAWKLVGGETTKITLRNGFEITTTPEHKYITLEHNEFKERQASELKLGDRVVCSRKINFDNEFNI